MSKLISIISLNYFKSNASSPINFIGFKGPLHLYRNIFEGNIKLKKAEENQKQFKSQLNEITRGNPINKSEDQLNTIKNIKSLHNSQEKVIKLYNDYAKIKS